MIRLDNVSKIYPGNIQAVSDLCLDVNEGETLVLVGTSGSGKTTALKMINRLIQPSSGRIYVEDRDIEDWDPIELRRHIGYVIQSVGLFPHMTVADNVAIVPRLLSMPQEYLQRRTAEVLHLVGLEPDDYLRRYPSELSGGQQQRIGVARALAADPPIILMDEPFGALDPITRSSLQREFLDLKSRIGKTIVFVTHDIAEAVILGDRIAVMRSGKVEQIAPPAELIKSPANEFVSDFLGRQRFQLRLDAIKVRDIADTSPEALSNSKDMTKDKSVKADDPVSIALDIMTDTRASAIPVTDESGDTVGILRRESIISEIGILLDGGTR